MCGIVGYFNPTSKDSDQATLKAMTDAINHRGPDDAGYWSNPRLGIHFGHRRLSVIDLSQAGHQPMASGSERFTIVFNGEIYNHQVLRRELEQQNHAPEWRGHSDTETLLAAIEAWGVQQTLVKLTGMFAFALWDHKEQVLTLARDRMGEKPLYYGWQDSVFLFGSELKGLKQHPQFQGKIDRDVLTLLMRHVYIPAPYSIYQGIRKLDPGTFISLSNKDLNYRQQPKPQPYWSVENTVARGLSQPFAGSDEEAVSSLDRLLRDVIRDQMLADVPLGSFLSGGIDSSTITAIMQSLSSKPVKTFTIGFNEEGYNEAVHAKAIAQFLGTDHTELYVSPNVALDAIPRLPSLYDEPFADASQIPTFLVSQMTKQHVTVSLSGDGGDELFGGYNRYLWGQRMWKYLQHVPSGLRSLTAGCITSIPPKHLNRIVSGACSMMPGNLNISLAGDKAHKLATILDAKSPDEIYYRLISEWKQPEQIIRSAHEPETLITRQQDWPGIDQFEHRMMYLDSKSYLPDDILAKVDRAAMGVSLETRVPFLDHRIVELSWRIPLHMKIRNKESKWLLRQVMNNYIPRTLTERPKMGFAVPIHQWLRGPLRDWCENLLDETRLEQQGYFNPKPVQKKWQEHLSGERNWQYSLWAILMFQAWLEEQS